MRSPFAPLALAVLCSHLSLAQSQAQPSSSPAPTAVALPVSQALTLRQALRLTLTHNPDLAAARLELQAMEAAEIQAGARPNPELGLPAAQAAPRPCSGASPLSWGLSALPGWRLQRVRASRPRWRCRLSRPS